MTIVCLNGILSGHINRLALAFASGNEVEFKEALSNLRKFEKDNKLIKEFECKECGAWVFDDRCICNKCKGEEE